MKDFKTITIECYEALPTLPGCYKDFSSLAENVNSAMCANGKERMTNESLRSAILTIWPKARFEDTYECKGKTIQAVRIVIAKEVILSNEDRDRLKSSITSVLDTKCQTVDGWYDLVSIAPQIKEGGVDYKVLGFMKFGDMLATVFGDELKVENHGDKTKKYVHIEGLPTASISSRANVKLCTSRQFQVKTEKWKPLSAAENGAFPPNLDDLNRPRK